MERAVSGNRKLIMVPFMHKNNFEYSVIIFTELFGDRNELNKNILYLFPKRTSKSLCLRNYVQVLRHSS